ncbi:MAG: Xaa-Pro peptidase family protein [Patescibacteria group bacterium]
MYRKRINQLVEDLSKNKIDLAFIANPQNIYYYSGFSPEIEGNIQPMSDPEVFLIIHRKQQYILGDSRLKRELKKYKDFTFIEIPAPASGHTIGNIIKNVAGKGQIGLEYQHISYFDLNQIYQVINPKLTTDISEIIDLARTIKDETEIKLLKKAAQITSLGYKHALSLLRPGITEIEISRAISVFFLQYADGNSFEPIVAFGSNSAIPHHHSNQTKIKNGNILLIDLGCKYQGYCGDMTRAIYLGQPSPEFTTRYQILLQIQNKTIKQIRPGTTSGEIDNFVRSALKPHHLESNFIHGTGHGIGLAIHEAPSLKPKITTKLTNNMVFSIEPGLYFPGWGGLRLEDIIYLKNGQPVNITPSSKRLSWIEI